MRNKIREEEQKKMGDVLKGKVAVVTGSGQGIGRAIAIGMAKEGAKVVTNNRRRGSTGYVLLKDSQIDSLDRKKKEWLHQQADEAKGDAETTTRAIKDLGGESLPFFGDISNFEVARKMIQTTVDTFGKIDILVNVAGTFKLGSIWEMTEEDWDHVTLTKPKGYFNTIRHAIPHMMKQKWGRILNCTSRAFIGDPLKHAPYCAANAGVVGLTKAVAIELYQYGITCNAFAPHARTRASFELDTYDRTVSEEESPWMDRKYSFSLDQTPSPDYLVPFLIYLTTDAAAKISGSVFNVGGNHVGLYSDSEIMRSIQKFGNSWTLDELKQQALRGLFMGYRSPAELK